jgi:hypothetical protein
VTVSIPSAARHIDKRRNNIYPARRLIRRAGSGSHPACPSPPLPVQAATCPVRPPARRNSGNCSDVTSVRHEHHDRRGRQRSPAGGTAGLARRPEPDTGTAPATHPAERETRNTPETSAGKHRRHSRQPTRKSRAYAEPSSISAHLDRGTVVHDVPHRASQAKRHSRGTAARHSCAATPSVDRTSYTAGVPGVRTGRRHP